MKMYPYQIEGAHWLAGMERAILADEMGLGKTAQAVYAMDLIGAESVLIIPPASVRSVWKNEVAKWSCFGHDINVLTSTQDSPVKGAVNIVNYDLLARGFEKTSFKFNPFMKQFLQWDWDLVVADEAHLLKEKDSLRTRAVLENRGIHGHTKRLWLLTGTPMPNHAGELWTPLAAMGATDLSYGDFIKRYCKMGEYGYSRGQPQGTNPEHEKELRALLRTVMKRRRKSLVMPDLPAIRIDDTPVPEVKIKVEEFFENALGDKAGTIRRIKEQEEFVTQVWQRAIASNGKMGMNDMIKVLEATGPSVALYRRWLGAVKVVSFLPIIIDELENKGVDKIVIFAHHKTVIQYLKLKLEKFNPRVIDGSASTAKRESAIHDFQYDKSVRVFIGQNIAAGTGITLTAACEVVMLEPDWVPSNNAQAIMRCHRIGQERPVRARFIRLADSLDDYISDTLARKTEEIVRIVD